MLKHRLNLQHPGENVFCSMLKLKQKAIGIVEHAEPNLSVIGLFGTLGYPVYYLLWSYLYPQPYENLALRLLCAFICLPWVLHRELPKRLKEFFPVYFFLSLFIVMPYFFSFMMLKNEWSMIWVMSFMAGTFLLTLFIFDWMIIIAMTAGGFMAAYATVHFLDGRVSFAYFVPEYIPIFLFSIAGGIIANHNRQLAHQSKISLLRSLSGSIAHEMRNPLSSITNAMSTVQAIIPDKPETHERHTTFDLSYSGLINIHEVIDESLATIKRGNKIIDSLLATLQDGAMDINTFKRLSSKNTIQNAISSYGYHDINDRKLVQENSSVSFDFFGDKDIFIYVLFNLLKNALHYRNKPGFNIIVTSEKGHQFNTIRVRDNGPGVPAGKREKIFDRFYTYGKSGGNGLGLSFCRRVIESFGGTITCDSQEGHWTEFIIRLPVYTSKTVEELKKDILKQKKILIVDDQISNRMLLQKYTSEWNCQSDQAENGQQALEMLSKKRYDLVFMDFEMPALDGDLAVKRLRSALNIEPSLAPHYMQVPVIGITALTLADALPRATRCGMNDVLSKPVRRADIKKVFERHFFSEATQATMEQEECLSGCRILLVDDNETSRKFMSMILEHYGCLTGQAENGEVALERLELQDYDLIIMDMEMPVMNGLQAAREIRKGDRFRRFRKFDTIPIIAITGNTDTENIARSKAAGMNHHIGKPVFRDELISVITAWLTSRNDPDSLGQNEIRKVPEEKNFWETIAGEKILDRSIISSLIETGGNELVTSILRLYINDTQEILERLGSAVSSGDIKSVDMLIHTLKGSSGSCGANRLYILTRYINESTRKGRWPGNDRWLAVLWQTFNDTSGAIKTMLENNVIDG